MKNLSFKNNAACTRTFHLNDLIGLIFSAFLLFIGLAGNAQSLRNSSQGSAPLNDKTLTINKPSGTAVGDVMIAGISVRPYNANNNSVPSGWTQVRNTKNANGNGDNTQYIYYKVATTADLATPNYTWGFNQSEGSAGGIMSFYNVETNFNPVDKSAGSTSGNSSTLVFTSPSITTTYANEMVIGFHCFGSCGTWTNPTGATFPMTQVVDVASKPVPDELGISMEMSYGVKVTPGATGSVTATASAWSEVGLSQILALIPKTTISYPTSPYCINEGTAPVTQTGVTGGVYSASSSNLSINSATGAVNLTASQAGSYTVTYRFGVSNAYSTTTTIVVKPVPTATIAGTASVCEDGTSPNITFTGAGGTPPYTFTYKINGGTNQTVSTSALASAVSIAQATSTAGTFTYSLVSVSDASCSQTQSGTAAITIKPAPTATISGTATVCHNSTAPTITFTGAAATAPYTFTYKINGGANQTITTTSGNSVTVAQPTTATGTFTYTLVSVTSAASCSQVQSGSAAITVTALPTATITGNTTICQSAAAPNITFTGAGGTAPYTFTYKINGGTSQTVTTTSGSSVAVSQPTSTAGTFTYTLVSVASAASCSQVQSGSAVITVTALPTATVSGSATVCQSAAAPVITFTGVGGTAPYTFTYQINGGANQTVTTTSGSSVTVAQPTTTAGTYTYTLVSVTSAASCSQAQSGTATVTVTPTVGTPTPISVVSGTEPACQITNTTTTTGYYTTASNSTGLNGSLSNPAAGTINMATGVISWTNGFSGSVNIVVTANGCNGPSAAVVRTVVIKPGVGTPAFSSGSASARCQAAETITYTATASNASSITYSLDGTSSSAGNTIDPSTGAVTYAASWTGTSTITATATGCNGPATASHTVTTSVAPSASFAYAANPYCSSGTIAAVNFSGTSGGTFSSSAGLSIDALTGTVDITKSTPAIPGTTYTVKYSIPATGVCPASSISAPLTINVHAVWNGSVSRNWHDPNNWSCGGVPTLTSNALIPSGMPRYPIIYSGTGTTRNLTIQAGATIIDSAALTVAGTIYNSGKGAINALAGKVEFAAGTSQVIPSNLFFSNTISDIVISDPAGITLSGPLRVTGSVAFGNVNNCVFTTGDSLTLASVAASDAKVKDITNAGANTGNTIAGEVIVERYMPAKRAYRFLTAPVNSKGSIKANWMENSLNQGLWAPVNPYPGYGTNITGAGDAANGFDATQTHNPSMFTFNNLTQTWVAIPNTNGIMSVGNAYRIIVRGDRSTDMTTNTPPPTITTLRAKGTVVTGNVKLVKTGTAGSQVVGYLSGTTGAYNLVANPYPSAINWLTADKTDICATIYTFDPNVSGSNKRGGYVAYNCTIGTNSDSASSADNYIQSGQAFFVQTIGPNPSVTFKETDKSGARRAIFRTGNSDPNISIRLLLPSQNSTIESADGCKVYFSDQYENTTGNEDSYKFTNQDENLAVISGGNALSIEGRKPVTGADSVPLKLWQLTQKSYLLKFNFNNFSYNSEAYLKDKYLSTLTQLNTNGETIVPVSITSDAESFAPDRYKIVFEPFATLPLHLLGIKATEKNNGIEVGWTAEAESNMEAYEVERSWDGQQFVTAGTVKAKINPGPSSFYTWFDLVPNKGDNYYRIKSLDKAGAAKYSSVAKVRLEQGISGISIFPNPVQGKVMSMQFLNIQKGNYAVTLINNLGEKVYSGVISHSRGSAVHIIELKTSLSPGLYQLMVSNNEQIETISALVQ